MTNDNPLKKHKGVKELKSTNKSATWRRFYPLRRGREGNLSGQNPLRQTKIFCQCSLGSCIRGESHIDFRYA